MKKMTSNPYRKQILTGGALVLAATASVFAQQKPFMQGGTAQPPAPSAAKPAAAETPKDITTSTNVVDELFNGKIPDALANGKVNVNVRARYEQANEEGVPAVTKNSYAPTVRTRVGFTTAPLYGFQAMVEGVNVSAIGPEHNYNAAGSNGQGARPVVADPTLTRLDQAWAGFTYTNWVSAKVGLQQINLDNQRFIGDSGWRQNMQTFEAAGIGSEPLPDLKLYYAYVWDVHRVFGNVDDLPAANRDFDSDSHLINVSYSGWKYGRFVGYAYLLDLSNAAGDANSSATYGGYFAGAAPLNDQISVDYRAEYAFQTDYGKSPLNYSANYYNAEAGLNVKPVAFGAGYEDLGSGANTGAAGGRAAFRTPLATLHAFNGWDDMFLNTPNDGLQDFYGYLQVTLPAQIPVRFIFHKFNAEHGDGDYGEEYDVAVSKKFGKHWAALVKYAYYNGNDPAAPALTASHVDVQRFWAQVEFNF